MKRFLKFLPQLFPRRFREEFAAEIAEVIGRDYERSSRRGRFDAGWFAFRTTVDVLRAAIRERMNPTWVDQRKEIDARSRSIGGQLENWRRDLSFVARGLFRTPVFTLIAVLTLTLAIGANTAIFSVVKTVLLDPLGFPEPDRLVSIRGTAPGSNLPEEFGVGAEFYVQYRENATALEDLGAFMEGTMTVRMDDRIEQLPVSAASPSLFSTLGVQPVIGRLPTEQDEDAQVVVLSHWLWTTWFGRDPGVIGQSIEVASGLRTVVGVMGPEFGFPHERISLWMHNLPSEPIQPGGFSLNLVGRLAPAADHATLRAQLAALAGRLPERFGGSVEYTRIIEQHRPVVRSLEEELVGDMATPLWILLGTVAIVLLIACANVANLLIVRAEGRRRDLAVRRALGADRADLIRAQMIEALLVAAAGGVGGVLLAFAGLPLLIRTAPESIPRLGSVGLDLAAGLHCGSRGPRCARVRLAARDPLFQAGVRGHTAIQKADRRPGNPVYTQRPGRGTVRVGSRPPRRLRAAHPELHRA